MASLDASFDKENIEQFKNDDTIVSNYTPIQALPSFLKSVCKTKVQQGSAELTSNVRQKILKNFAELLGYGT
jgi:hypothetical protein